LIIKLKKVIYLGITLIKSVPKNLILKKLKYPRRIIQEPKAWTKKYFTAPSDSMSLEPQMITGIKDNKLISRPIQI